MSTPDDPWGMRLCERCDCPECRQEREAPEPDIPYCEGFEGFEVTMRLRNARMRARRAEMAIIRDTYATVPMPPRKELAELIALARRMLK